MKYLKLNKTEIKKTAELIFKISHPEEIDQGKIESMVWLLESLGIEVYESLMKEVNISGYIMRSPKSGNPLMVINSEDHIVRQRFTMAHELGHLLFHFKWEPRTKLNNENIINVAYREDLEVYSDERKIEESEANAFAVELLMPEALFISSVKSGMNDGELSKFFGVPKKIVKIRKKDLAFKAQGIN